MYRPIYSAYYFWFATDEVGLGTKTVGGDTIYIYSFFRRVKMHFDSVNFNLVRFFA